MSDETKAHLTETKRAFDDAQTVYRSALVDALDSSGFREVHEFTGLSTATLQKWKNHSR